MINRFAPAFMAAAVVIATPALAAAVVGQPAPSFTATDSNGRKVSLSDYRGKTVVLEWTNAECPFVQKHYNSDNMQKLQSEAKAKAVVWLTVNSGAAGKQGYVTGTQANTHLREVGASPTAYLIDSDGAVGRAYGARTTPHMFVIDGKGMLAYAGGIDDIASADPGDLPNAKNYVREALADIAAGKAVTTATSRPYGCSVKY